MSRRTDTTITISLDVCNAAGFLDYAELGLEPRSYNQLVRLTDTAFPPTVALIRRTQVVISACQLHQVAGEAEKCGAMTYLLTDKLTGSPDTTAAEVVRNMRERFQKHPKPSGRQLPQIASRYPLTESFQLLPDPTNLRDHHANFLSAARG
ncbi:hypothetical protein FRC00_000007 [Tulasnella sp. 408]|nr:hypothetical protein FRC00_000007 [Tulasnella sp. 408]